MAKKTFKVVSFPKEATIDKASEIKEQIVTVLKAKNGIKLDLSSMKTVDHSCLQIIYSAVSTFRKNKLDVDIIGELTESLREDIKYSGICNYEVLTGDQLLKEIGNRI